MSILQAPLSESETRDASVFSNNSNLKQLHAITLQNKVVEVLILKVLDLQIPNALQI